MGYNLQLVLMNLCIGNYGNGSIINFFNNRLTRLESGVFR